MSSRQSKKLEKSISVYEYEHRLENPYFEREYLKEEVSEIVAGNRLTSNESEYHECRGGRSRIEELEGNWC